MKQKYYDFIHNKKEKDNRSGEEIAADVLRGAGIKVV